MKETTMITQILCAIDDAEHSETACEFAIDLARQLSAKIVFHMVNPAVAPSPRGAAVYLWSNNYIDGYLDEARRRAWRAGIEQVTCESARANSIAHSIVACADSHAVDFIVVGASGKRRMIDWFRRPVSRLVADTAHCPVFIIGHVRSVSLRGFYPLHREAA
jgi:nucleotide-binding universal stress UspA family protein